MAPEEPLGVAGARVSHPQRIIGPANVGTSFNLPLLSVRCGWDSRGPGPFVVYTRVFAFSCFQTHKPSLRSDGFRLILATPVGQNGIWQRYFKQLSI